MSNDLKPQVGRRAFVKLLLGGIAVFAMHPQARSAIAASAAEDYVTNIADAVMDLANSGGKGSAMKARFASLLNRYINLKSVANYALGPYSKKLPPGKRDEFYRLVSNYTAAVFVYYLDDFRGSDLKILSSSTQGKFTTIQSAIMLKGGGSEQVKWRLSSGGGGLKVSDVNVKGVWLTIAMRDKFNKVLGRSDGDFDALFDELREAETW